MVRRLIDSLRCVLMQGLSCVHERCGDISVANSVAVVGGLAKPSLKQAIEFWGLIGFSLTFELNYDTDSQDLVDLCRWL